MPVHRQALHAVGNLETMRKAGAIILLFLTSCSTPESTNERKILDFGLFTIETPLSWTKVEQTGIDSYVGTISIDTIDTLTFDIGMFSDKLYEYDPSIVDSSMISFLGDGRKFDSSEVIIVKDRRLIDSDKCRKNNVTWDTIDGRSAKMVFPRRSGIGITGAYIDSLWQNGSQIEGFSIHGKNLRPENEMKVRAALKTIKFKRM